MNNSHFTFPPPPPPPPSASADYNRYPPYPSGQREQNGRGRGGPRGYGARGRGYDRGGSRGGHASGYGGYPPVEHTQTNGQYGQSDIYGSNYPIPNYPAVQQPQYPSNMHNTYGHQPQHPLQAPYPNPPQPSYSGFAANVGPSAQNYGAQSSNQRYGQGNRPPRAHDSRHGSSRGPINQPIVMPPIRVGRDGRGGILRTEAAPSNPPAQFDHGPPMYNSYQEPPPFQRNPFDAPNPHLNSRGRGHRRGYSDTLDRARHARPSGQVAPAVPSFGNTLPGGLSNRPPNPGASGDATKKPKKKKRRRHNQLGLTPKTEEHESSSEEEDDQDEEMKLAAAVGAASQKISFEYKGQTSTLQSPAEITAWIAERKKRFPTKARAAEAAERKKQNEEAQRLARQAAKESQERRRAEAKERQEKSKAEAKEKRDKQEAAAKEKRENSKETGIVQHVSGDKDDAALRAKLKVEKLRRRLEKEERRIAKAEAKAARNTAEARPTTESSNQHQSLNNKKRKRTDSLESSGMKGGEVEEVSTRAEPTESILKVGSSALQIAVNDAVAEEAKVVMIAANAPINSNNVERDTAQNPLTPTSQPSILDIEHRTPPPEPSRNHLDIAAQNDAAANNNTVIEANTSDNPNLSLSITSSDISSGSDYDSTSSSGSSSSSSSPSDSDAAPETAPSKPPNPARVPPPKRRKAKTENVICRNFLRNGRCARGEKCHFKHELPEKGSLSKAERRQAREVKAKAREGKKERERKGLYQRLVEQEKEEEDRQILSTIIEMGEKGLLSAESEQKEIIPETQ